MCAPGFESSLLPPRLLPLLLPSLLCLLLAAVHPLSSPLFAAAVSVSLVCSLLRHSLPILLAYSRRPRRPPFLRVESVGTGVVSSMRPIFMPARASARRADWAPGPYTHKQRAQTEDTEKSILSTPAHAMPNRRTNTLATSRPRHERASCEVERTGVLVRVPPVARSLTCRAVIPRSLHFSATSCAANMAA